MFGFIKKVFFTELTILLSVNLLTITPLRCISMTNQECKVRSQIVNVNSDKPVFFPFSIKTSKCCGSCNNINDPYAKMCVPDVVKNLTLQGLEGGWSIRAPLHLHFFTLLLNCFSVDNGTL